MSALELKIKLYSLAEESKYIRKHELRLAKRLRKAHARENLPAATACEVQAGSLHSHRMNIVRPAARCTHLALGYIRGTPYKAMEKTVREGNNPNWKEVAKLIKKYGSVGNNFTEATMEEWIRTP